MLKAIELTKYYDDKLAVDNLSFEINNGEILGLLGVNGAGKTTTFRMILGIIEASGGQVFYNDQVISVDNSENIGYLTEERSLLSKYTLAEQIIFYARLKGMNKKDIIEKMDYWLERFNLLDYKDKRIKELSKGNQQKVQLITAIIHEPDLLILDEPFSGLDPINLNLFKEIITSMKDNGCAILFSSHRMDHVELFCQDVIIMLDGKPIVNDKISNLKKASGFSSITIKANITQDQLLSIEGVTKVDTVNDEYMVMIENNDVANLVFDAVKTLDVVEKFVLNYPTMEEIFIKKVGEYHVEV